LIPCIEKRPVFSKNRGNELWVMLMEISYATLHGSYGAMEGGCTYIAMNNLTGMPSDRIMMNEDGKKIDSFAYIVKFQQKKYDMCCSFNDSTRCEHKIDNGLVAGHAYTILEAVEYVPHGDNEFKQRYPGVTSMKLIKLRNPWGKHEWNGDWSDNDDNWTPMMKQKLDVQVADDGIFYIGRTYAEGPEVDGNVYFTSAEPLEIGDIVSVKILIAEEYDLTGEAIFDTDKEEGN
jgi:calpain-15